MNQFFVVPAAVIALLTSIAASAQEHGPQDHQKRQAGMSADQRQLVSFPPAMREHTLSNMRDHLLALSEILTAMSAAQYAEAAGIAMTRLGMESPSAEGCKNDGAASTAPGSKPAGMDHQMAQFMPAGMRSIGLAMHQSASVFADEAGKASRTGNPQAALTALSKVTGQCASCHTAYKLQ